MAILVPISPGELIDKITILQVKLERIQDQVKLENVSRELWMLERIAGESIQTSQFIDQCKVQLREVNAKLWDIEEAKRDCERRKDFGPEFIQLARRVYMDNDLRASLKKSINLACDSDIVEEKSYAPYNN